MSASFNQQRHVDMVDALLSQPTGAWLDYPPAIAVA